VQVLDAPASDSFVDRARSAPLWAHGVALLVVLLALIPVVGTESVFSADEGAAIIQARRVAESGTWVGAHPLPQLDPEVAGYPIHLAVETGEGFHELTRHPLYVEMLVVAWDGGLAALMAVSIVGTALAALLAGALAGRLDERLGRPTLWAVGLASPLVFDSYLVIAHTLGAALAAAAAWFLIGRDPRWWLPAGAISVAGLSMIRSEGVLLGLSLGAVLFVMGAARRDGDRLRAGVVAGVSAVAGYLLDDWWTESLKADSIGTAGASAERFQGGLHGRFEGFKRTWLWIDSRGMGPGDELILLAIVLAVMAAIAVRIGATARVITGLSAASVVLLALRVLAEPHAIVPGLVFAFPLLLIGLALLRPHHLRLGDGRGQELLAAAALFAVVVLATQYSVGGTTEWGGRYFALALPLITPLLVAAVLDGAVSLDRVVARRWLGAVVALSLLVPVLGVLGLRRSKARTAELVTAVEAATVAAGADTVVVTSMGPVGRWSWPIVEDRPWALVEPDRFDDLAGELERAGVSRVVHVSFLDDGTESDALARHYERGPTFRPSFDDRWAAVVYE